MFSERAEGDLGLGSRTRSWPRRKEPMAGAGERGILGVSRRGGAGKTDPPGGSRKECLIFDP